jgi:hypothetical protein
MKRKPSKEDKDNVRLRKFVAKVNAEAKRRFSRDGDCYLDIEVRDARLHQPPAANLPVLHPHLIETDKQWRDAISSLMCNASSAMDRLYTTFRCYENEQNMRDNRMALGAELADLKTKSGIMYSPSGAFPKLPDGLRYVGLKWETTEELHEAYCETKGLWPADRVRVLEHVIKMMRKLEAQVGHKVETFAVIVKDGSARVYAVEPRESEEVRDE